jgi:GT2 family glycosyltransferase
MVVGFTTTCADSVYDHKSCEFKFHSWRGVLDATFISDLLYVSGFRRVLRFPSPIKLIAEILLKVALNTITLPSYLQEKREDKVDTTLKIYIKPFSNLRSIEETGKAMRKRYAKMSILKI